MEKRGPTRREFLAGALAAALVPGVASSEPCARTDDNPEGPFYLPGAPFRTRLAEPGEPGRRLSLSGRVLALPECVSAPGAVLDLWHASDAGFYYNLEGAAAPGEFQLRGRVRAGAEGRYSFETVLPGHYRASRNWMRPRHVHMRVEHPGYRTLITQIYFRGDPHLEADPLVRPGLVVALEGVAGPEEGGGRLAGVFDIVLAPA